MWAVALATVLALAPVPASDSECYSNSSWTGICTSNSGSQVDISAGGTVPGSSSGTEDTTTEPPSRPAEPDPAPAEEGCAADDPLGCRENYEVGTLPDVTLADLASFRPAVPTLTGEPAGFGVVGMPTNLVAAASEQRIPGTLLGWNVTVRFIPARFVFDHGDGTTATTPTGGTTWQQLRQAQFTPTATSHPYRTRGTYTLGVTVQYTAAVDFGSGTYRPVPGYITATTTGYQIRIVEARTALVQHTCTENPTGPGC